MKNVLKRLVVLFLVLSVFMAAVPMAFADRFTGYNCITTKEQLNDVRKSLSAKFYLGNDIVFTEADFAPGGAFYNNGKGWEPIGSSGSNGFKGVFDGNGHVIKGLKINATGQNTYFTGLFGYNLGTINDVKLENVDIKVSGGNYAYVGAVCGATSKKGITNCWASGNINVSDIKVQAVAGGIAGGMYSGYIEKCINFCKIDITDSSSITAGGIAGTTASGITNCGNAGSISAKGRGDVYGGGIVGDAGKVSGNGSSVSINNVYNVGTVSVDSLCDIYVGGIAGDSVVSISQVFNSGVIAGRANTYEFKGRIIGRNNGGTISDAYYITETAEQSGGMKGITAEQAANKSTFKGFDFDSTWVIENGIPVIKAFVAEKEEGGGSGDTSSDNTGSNTPDSGDSSDNTSTDTSSDSGSDNTGDDSILDEDVSKPVEPPKVEDDQIADGGEGDKDGGVDTNPPVTSTPSEDQPDIGDTNDNPTDNPTENTTSGSADNTTSGSEGDNTSDPPEGTESNPLEGTTSDVTSDSVVSDPNATDDPFADPDDNVDDEIGKDNANKGNQNTEEFEWGLVIAIVSAVILITAGVVLAVKKGWFSALVKK